MKNPFLSAWMSAGNTMLGAARGYATAEARRNVAAALSEGTRLTLRMWADVWSGRYLFARAAKAHAQRRPRPRRARRAARQRR